MLHEHVWPHAAIEIQLAHLIKNETEAAYNYERFLPVRRLMMQRYSDYLDSLRLQRPQPLAVCRLTGDGNHWVVAGNNGV